jgi:thiol-disulfide isomerase/thioredoxin
MKRTLIVSLALVIVAACKPAEQPAKTAAVPKPKPAPQAASAEQGAKMPEYSAAWLDGTKFDLASRRKNVVLLNLWATWCGPCRFEIPVLQKMHTQYGPKGFEVIGVSVDEGSADAVKQFVTENKMTYPIALDPDGKLANIFQTSVLPTTALIDRNGTIVWKHFGLIEENDPTLKKAIEKAL